MVRADLQSKNIQDIYRLSPMQEGIYFHAQTEAGSSAYFSQTSYRFHQALDVSLVEMALNDVVSRHDVLRTVFSHQKTDEIVQIILRERAIDFHYEDVRSLASVEQTRYITAFREQDRRRSFDLNKDMLLRVSMLQLTDTEFEFIWSFHHILMDGWCTGILIREYMTCYEALAAGRRPALPRTGQYRSFIQWLEQQPEAASKTYWSRYLSDFDGPTRVSPSAFASNANYDNQEVLLELDETTTDKLLSFVKDRRITLNTFFQAVWGIVLARYNDCRDVVFGSVCSVRPADIADVEQIVGLFINTVPTRVRFTEETTFGELIQAVQVANSEAELHKFLPLTTIQSLTSQKNKLFDHLFIFENFPLAELAKNEAAQILHQHNFSQTNYSFNVVIVPGSALTLKFNYDANRFATPLVQRIAQHTQHLLRAAIQQPQQRIDLLPMLSSEQHQALLQLGQGPVCPDPQKPLTHTLRQWSRLQPHHPAVVESSQQLTYAQLDAQVQALAHYLRRQMNLQTGQRVGVWLPRGLDAVVATLAVWTAGGVYVPINPSLPAARREAMWADAPLDLLISDTDQLWEALQANLPLLLLDLQREQWSATAPSDWQSWDEQQQESYVIFTSGSSGQPKGVPILHQALSLRAQDHAQRLNLTPTDRVLQFASQSFDASLIELAMSLVGGSTLVIAAESVKGNSALLGQLVRTEAVTVAILPPVMLQELVEESLPSLRLVITTGEKARLGVSLQYAGRGVRVLNGYGPTEACVGATFYELQSQLGASYQRRGSVPIGRAMLGTGVWVVDRQGRLQPPGVAGELVIGGGGLTRGYVSGAGPGVFGELSGVGRVYHSGDIGYWNEEGDLEYIGRRDSQVQIRGIRVEVEGVEQQLGALAGVKMVAVVAVGDPVSLVAYVVAVGGCGVAELRQQAQSRLAGYMVPTQWRLVEQLPLTTNGKVDRKALLHLEIANQSASDVRISLPADETLENAMPITPEEIVVATAYAQVLRKAEIGRNDSFFELGGDSIKAIQISSRLYRAGYQTDARTIFSSPRVHELATQLTQITAQTDQTEITGLVPLMPIQAEFLTLNHPQPETYTQAVAVRLNTRLSPANLGNVLSVLRRHHDALRITVQSTTQPVTQYNQPYRPVTDLLVFNLTDSSGSEVEFNTLWNKIKNEISLVNGPLLKAVLFQMPDHDRLGLVVHHWVIDGISWRILLEDMTSLVQQAASGVALTLPNKTESVKAWAEALHQFANSDHFINDELRYWQQQATLFPQSLTKRRKNSYQAVNPVQRTVDAGLTQSLLTGVHRAYHTEINEILLAALGLAVKQVFGVDHLAVLLEGHGREQVTERVINIDRTIGWFTSTCPVVIPCALTNGLGEQLIAVKEALRGIPKKRLGYGLLKYGTDRLTPTQKEVLLAPDVVFNYLGQFDEVASTDDFAVIQEDVPMNVLTWLSHPLVISSLVVGGELKLTLRFDNELLTNAQMNALADQFIRQLTHLVEHCCAQERSMLTPSDITIGTMSLVALNNLQDRYFKDLGTSISDLYPLTPMQEGMLFYNLAHPTSDAYWYQVAYNLARSIMPDAVQDCLDALVGRHDVLRTVFDYEQTDELLQLVLADRKAAFSFTDLSQLASDAQQEAMEQYRTKDRTAGVDIRKDDLMRVCLFRLSDNEHVFIWSCHHILMDGWCMGVLIREFTALYEARLRNAQIALPATTPFKKYVAWLEQKNRDEALTYWKSVLADYDETAALPRSQSLRDGYTLAEHQWTIDTPTTEVIRQLASAQYTTVNTIFQTVWGILLGVYTNRNDVVFGSVTAGRPAELPGVESAVGLFINTLPIRVDYASDESFAMLLNRIQAQNLASLDHQYVSLVSIQAQNQLRQNLFDHIIEFENYPIATLLSDGTASTEWNVTDIISHEHNGYDFTVVVTPGDQLAVKFQYNTQAFEAVMVMRVERLFRHLLKQVLANPDVRLTALTITTPEEEACVLNDFNQTERAYPSHQTFADLFEQQAARTPNAPAAVCQGRVLTYTELNVRANQVAHYLLTKAALPPQSMVSVMMERSEQSIICMVGIMKARCAYVPIDPQLPAERRQYMLDDTSLQVVFVDSNSSIKFNTSLTLVEFGQLETYATSNPTVERQPADLAYVIYTSGSTGQPKGVMLEQRGLVNHLLSRIDSFAISTVSKVVQSASQSFDIHLWQSLAPLLAGGQVVIIDRETCLNPPKFWQTVASSSATLLQVVPTYLVELLKVAEHMDVDLSLRYMLTIGEALKRPLVERWFNRFQTIPLVNTYGPTEASDTITQQFMSEVPETGAIPIGKPIHNMRVYLLDRYGRLCPVGVKGELVVAGVGVGRGYLNNPQKTAEAFGDNSCQFGERSYRTGDVARWTSDGILDYFGRQDHQVKIRGHRIELGELEEVLMKHPAIDNAAVLVYQEQHLAAYVKSSETLSVQTLREFLQQHLPEYMIPSFFVMLDSFPLTASGKINRKELPVPDVSLTARKAESANRPEEQALVTIWQQVLNQPTVGINHTFFELGGDSIKAIQIVTRIRQVGYQLEIKDVFEHPILEDLASCLRRTAPPTAEAIAYQAEAFAYDELSLDDMASISSMFN